MVIYCSSNKFVKSLISEKKIKGLSSICIGIGVTSKRIELSTCIPILGFFSCT